MVHEYLRTDSDGCWEIEKGVMFRPGIQRPGMRMRREMKMCEASAKGMPADCDDKEMVVLTICYSTKNSFYIAVFTEKCEPGAYSFTCLSLSTFNVSSTGQTQCENPAGKNHQMIMECKREVKNNGARQRHDAPLIHTNQSTFQKQWICLSTGAGDDNRHDHIRKNVIA